MLRISGVRNQFSTEECMLETWFLHQPSYCRAIFQKISTLAKLLKLPILNSSSFHRIQKTYLVPSIDRLWIQKQESTLREFQNTDIIVLGDGRMDSPGHSAQYCSYTFMEYTSKKILCITTMDKRSTDRKSTNLEKLASCEGCSLLKTKASKL